MDDFAVELLCFQGWLTMRDWAVGSMVMQLDQLLGVMKGRNASHTGGARQGQLRVPLDVHQLSVWTL